jgi:hypothetical protein
MDRTPEEETLMCYLSSYTGCPTETGARSKNIGTVTGLYNVTCHELKQRLEMTRLSGILDTW